MGNDTELFDCFIAVAGASHSSFGANQIKRPAGMTVAQFCCEVVKMRIRPLYRLNRSTYTRGMIALLTLVLVALPLTACSQDQQADPDEAVANISPYNHTADYIHQLYINGEWGGNSYAYGGGGSFVCCLVYPRQWHKGLSATVRWTTSSSDPNGSGEETWHEAVVPIDRYDKTGTTLNAHFLPENKVRLIITSQSAGSPGYPGPDAPEKPADWPYP